MILKQITGLNLLTDALECNFGIWKKAVHALPIIEITLNYVKIWVLDDNNSFKLTCLAFIFLQSFICCSTFSKNYILRVLSAKI